MNRHFPWNTITMEDADEFRGHQLDAIWSTGLRIFEHALRVGRQLQYCGHTIQGRRT